LPTGVRTASMMYASAIAGSFVCGVRRVVTLPP